MKLFNLLFEIKTPSVFNKFFKRFPADAQSWDKATDEIQDLTRYIREYYNEVVLDADLDGEDHPKGIKSMDWRSFKTPSTWNTRGQIEIVRIYNMLDAKQKKEFIADYAKKYFKPYF